MLIWLWLCTGAASIISFLMWLIRQITVVEFKMLGAGFSTISIGGAGVGIGIVFGSFLLAFARNPTLVKELFNYAILGFALTEAIALFGLMMAFLILFAF